MPRQMIRWNQTGEIQVIDTDARTASAFLSHREQDAPLSAYELDNEMDESEDYTIIRREPFQSVNSGMWGTGYINGMANLYSAVYPSREAANRAEQIEAEIARKQTAIIDAGNDPTTYDPEIERLESERRKLVSPLASRGIR